MSTTYTITDENFETVAKGLTLKQAAAYVGAFPSTLIDNIDRFGCACIGVYIVEPVVRLHRAMRPAKPIFVDM